MALIIKLKLHGILIEQYKRTTSSFFTFKNQQNIPCLEYINKSVYNLLQQASLVCYSFLALHLQGNLKSSLENGFRGLAEQA